MAVTATNSILVSAFPSIDDELFNYIEGVLDEHKNEFECTDHVYEVVGDMLHEVSGGSMGEREVKDICSQLLKALKLDSGTDNKHKENKILNAPVCLGSLAGNFEDEAEEVTSIWLKSMDKASVVDQRKLEKAEAKIKSKQEKRDATDKPASVPAIISKEATAVQASNKRETRMESKGTNKNMDIKIENFDIAFGDKTLLTGADLTLVYGRRYGMVGRNGIGKSTLLRMVSSGQLRISSHLSVLHVEQEVVGNDTIALDSVLECDEKRQSLLEEEKRLVNNNGPVDDTNSSSRLQDVYAELQAMEADKAPAKASVILAGLGFSPEMQRKATKEFSGGWRMRIALARALFSKPDLLLLDEPTNMLDMKAIIWLENYLQTWESTILVVSHDRRFLDTVATDVLHFHSQHIEAYKGNYSTFVKTMTEKLKHQQREYDAQQAYRQHVQEFIDKFRYNAKRASLVQSKIKMLEKLPDLKAVEKEASVTLRFPNPEFLQPPVLQLDEVFFSYPNTTKQVLCNVDLSANMGSRICIVGDNGSGKTTLLKLLIGDNEPTKGIRHCHRNLVIGYFTQHHIDQLDMNVSSLELISKRFPGLPSEEYRRQLGCFGVTGDLALQSVASLSGGQKSRVAFAAMAMLHPHFLVLDEPTNHLDVETVDALGVALKNFSGGVVLVSHDEQLIEMVCEELWVCKNGSVSAISGGFSQYRKIVEEELAAQA
ncbi:hypothetical protein JTE90_027971 [Oedothorax gibbosus]|uniref:ATP-binding cassette sub-family F member 3 n=1 Tax=Oedothorax gibbosus TaxID=931172 RepID=A0AAV6VGX9_9ARAC|nr:hypothetical protein JTE90_027971 [Oedothorax gibbosus]